MFTDVDPASLSSFLYHRRLPQRNPLTMFTETENPRDFERGVGVVSEMTVHKHGGPGSNSDLGSGNSPGPGSRGRHCRYSSQPSDLHLRPSAGDHD